jgi:hypothetical protein
MKLVVESYPTSKKHFVVAHHEEGRGWRSNTSVSSVIAEFPSRKQAEAAIDLIRWWGDHRFNEGRHVEQRMAEQEGRGR